MQIDLDYGQAEIVAKSFLKSDYAMLLEGMFTFESKAEYDGLKEAYEIIMRWYSA